MGREGDGEREGLGAEGDAVVVKENYLSVMELGCV